MLNNRILIVEDDAATSDYISRALVDNDMAPHRAASGREALHAAFDGQFDAIVLDRMLPDLDGLDVLKALRAGRVGAPVIMLSALGSTLEKVAGLDAGADDYLSKPFATEELLARLRVLLRRGAGEIRIETRLVHDSLCVDLLSRTVTRAGRQIRLQPREFRLLVYLMRHAGQVVTRTMLLEQVWDYRFDPATNVVDVQISRLRRKLEEPGDAPLLHTVWGVGYRFGAAE